MPSPKKQSRTFDYDFVVIGGGSAGYAAARTAVALGLKTAVVEGARKMGGLCILRGCMPTKALLESAHRLHDLKRAHEFGLRRVPSPAADWPRVIARKDRLIKEFASYRRDQLTAGKFTLLRARARFIDSHNLALNPVALPNKSARSATLPQSISAASILIATGSKVSPPPIPGLSEVGYLTSDDAIHLSRPPQSLAVLGGGAIAVEFADYFHKMGVPVTLIQRSPHILKSQDDDVGTEVENALRHDGMKVFTGTNLKTVSRSADGQKVVAFEFEGKLRRLKVAEILYALGREPLTEGLDLPAAGVALSGRAIEINQRLQTSCPHIFAAGDVSGPYEVVHVAVQQGETAAHNAAALLAGSAKSMRALTYSVPMEIIFSDPEVASVGWTEKAAKAAGLDVVSASYPFNDHGKSIIMGTRFGFVKVIADRSNGRIVGASVVGPHASDIIHEFAVAITLKATVWKFLEVPHYHPTLAEIVTYPVEDLAELLKHS